MKISIVIAVAPNRDAEVLSSLKNVDYPKKNYEVIVVKGLNPSENRNNGVKKAKGDIIAFIDDDAIVHKDILKNAERFFNKYKNMDIIGGPQLTPKSDKWFARISGYALESYFGTNKMSKRYKIGKPDFDADENSLTSANCFVRKNVFKKIDGFNVKLFPGEDPEFFARTKKNGFKIAYVPDIVIYHRRRATLLKFMEQFFKYGYFRLKKEREMKTRPGILFFMPSFFIIHLLMLPILAAMNKIFLAPLMIYILADLIVSLHIGIKKIDLPAMILLPFIFLLLHLSYGFGMIYYLVKN